MTGARMKTTLSAAFGMMSSFSASFTPSARLCSRPNGPCTLGPIRCCIRATTRRSHQMLNSVSSTRITKISTALMMITQAGIVAELLEVPDRQRREGVHAAPPALAVRVTGLPAGPTRAHRQAGRGGRRPDGALGQVADGDREVERAERAAERDDVADREPVIVRASLPDEHDRLARRTPHRLVAVLHPAVVEQLLPRRAGPGRRSAISGDPRIRHVVVGPRRRPAARRPTARRRSSPPRPARWCGSRAATSQLLGDAGEHAQVGQRRRVVQHLAELADPALPVDEGAGPVGHRGHREDHVGDTGRRRTRAPRGRRRTRRRRPPRGLRAGSGRSSRSTPPTTRPPSRPSRGGVDDGVGVAADRCRAGGRRPRRRRGRPGLRRRRPGDRRAAGWAARRSRRHPGHRRGAGPRRSGRRCARPAARPRTASPGVAASALADQDHGVLVDRHRVGRRARPSTTAASSPGRVGIRVPDILCSPREVYGAIE